MNWQEAIRHYKIQKRYHNASIREPNLLAQGINDIGLRWLKAGQKPSLYLHGNAGCGKTYFMTALLRHLIETGVRGLVFIRSDDLDKELLDASMGNLVNSQGYKVYEKQVIEKYSEVRILFIDDLGTEKDSDRIRQQYGKIIDERVGNDMPTVYTSNLDLDQMTKALGDRIGSRLQIAMHIKFSNDDFRKTASLPLL